MTPDDWALFFLCVTAFCVVVFLGLGALLDRK